MQGGTSDSLLILKQGGAGRRRTVRADRGGVGRYRVVRGDAGWYGAMQSVEGRCRVAWGDAGR
jgi:hypothetical protein